MVIEWEQILIVIGILAILLPLIKLAEKKLKLNNEVKRKIFHISIGLVVLPFPYFFESTFSVGILCFGSMFLLILLRNSKFKNTIGSVLHDVGRDSLGEIFFAISVFLIFYLSKETPILYYIPILILTFADSTAALIGKNYAKENLAQFNEDKKSIEGSFSFFIVAFLATLIPLLLWSSVGREELLIISIIVGFCVSLVEMISHTGNDNLLIPLTTFAFLSTLINLDVEALRVHLIILLVIYIIVHIANMVKNWSKLALIELIVVGYLTVILYGWYAIIPSVMLLLTVLRFPKIKENEKTNIYDARIIETNVIIGIAICGIVAITGWKKEFFMIYASCYSMHLIINTYVRFKYYWDFSKIKCIIFSILKGMIFVYFPSFFLQKIVFEEISSISVVCSNMIAMILSALLIDISKKNVKKEEITIDNGYLHLKIVLALTVILSIIEYIKIY